MTGHIAIGEKSEEAVVYKTFKSLGILKDPEDFRRIGDELGFRKRGGPQFPRDHHVGDEFHYHMDGGKNDEFVSFYALVVDDPDRDSVAQNCDWRRIEEVRFDVEKNPATYGSSLRQFIRTLEKDVPNA